MGKEDSAGVTGGTAIDNECDICGGDSYSAAELFNLDLKILPEDLNNYYKVEYIARESKKKGSQKINLQNIKIASNIILFSFIEEKILINYFYYKQYFLIKMIVI